MTGRPVPWPLSYIPVASYLPAQPQQAAAAKPGTPPAATPGGPAGGRPPVSVITAKAERKPMPVRLEAIGTVQTLSSVIVRSRVDSQIMEVGFKDGQVVKQGDMLFRLDSRQIEAQLKQSEALVAKDKASLVSAEADLKRAEELARRDFGTDQRLDTARALVMTLRASIRGGEAAVEGLKVQLSYYTITAPVGGRVGMAGLKAGNIAKSGDSSVLLATINQVDPIYVTFSMPQRHLPEIRDAMIKGTAIALATPQGYAKGVEGKLAVVDNAVDATTGTITLRALFDNPGEVLWPGALCQVRVTLSTEPNAITIARDAVQTGQNGTFLFVVTNGVAQAKPVVVNRIVDGLAVLTSGLTGDETIVVDGQLVLTNGARVVERPQGVAPPAGARPPAASPTTQRGSQG
ncbi:MAG: efflux RND transporter periplasmic adaptor subunit [Bosea sp. (in: a-proteobacteria)]